jgi:hypothetical protein
MTHATLLKDVSASQLTAMTMTIVRMIVVTCFLDVPIPSMSVMTQMPARVMSVSLPLVVCMSLLIVTLVNIVRLLPVNLPVGAPTLNALVMTVTYALLMNALKMKANV